MLLVIPRYAMLVYKYLAMLFLGVGNESDNGRKIRKIRLHNPKHEKKSSETEDDFFFRKTCK